jgi:hypothetical protein
MGPETLGGGESGGRGRYGGGGVCAGGTSARGDVRGSAQAFEDHGHPLTTADAHRLQPKLLVVELE